MASAMKWKPGRFRVNCRYGWREVQGLRSGPFGLHFDRRLDRWRLSHLPTGLGIWFYKHIRNTKRFAARILPLADWSSITQELASNNRPLREQVRAIRAEIEREEDAALKGDAA